MATKVVMPQMGESVIEGTITKWLKQKGDIVEEYEPLIEVNTDKVDTEIPSPTSGTLLETLVDEGAVVNAGTVLAWIGEPGEAIQEGEKDDKDISIEAQAEAEIKIISEPPTSPEAVEPDVHEPVAEFKSPTAGRDRELGFISPVVAKIASEHKVDLFQVQGTGRSGRITKKDILNYVETRETAPAIAKPERDRLPTPISIPSTRVTETALAALPGAILPLTPVRKAIADHMVLSRRTSPHVTTVMEVDLSGVVAHRSANKEIFARDGVNLTFTAYFVSAVSNALKAHPIVNSSWGEDGIVLHREINVGMATSLGEEGLIVPVIRNADSLSLFGIARVVNDLANRARAKQLLPEEVRGGTLTITNHGTSGSLFATPIINQPQCAILGVGAIQKRVVVISDENNGDSIAIRPMVYLTLTFDHRILDGAIADYFLAKVVESLLQF
jgi:2-oxoglutarate dehydrogenase E2 component (dihydrolipoamide succinyltransferase)